MQNSPGIDIKKRPLISIIINCFNGEKYIKHALQSIIDQTYSKWEIIFWDNQSSDKSANLFKSFQDPRFRYFYSSRHTLLYEARNLAIQKSKGDYIAFLDVDDFWHPKKLELQLPFLNEGHFDAVCSNFSIYDEGANRTRNAFWTNKPSGLIVNFLLKHYYVGLLTLVIRKDSLKEKKIFFNDNYHIIGDYDLVMRFSFFKKIKYINNVLATYRIHCNNETIIKKNLFLSEMRDWIFKNKEIKSLRKNKNWKFSLSNYYYLEAKNAIASNDKQKYYKNFNNINSCMKKLLLLAYRLKFFINRWGA